MFPIIQNPGETHGQILASIRRGEVPPPDVIPALASAGLVTVGDGGVVRVTPAGLLLAAAFAAGQGAPTTPLMGA
jgi:hypothetical protein